MAKNTKAKAARKRASSTDSSSSDASEPEIKRPRLSSAAAPQDPTQGGSEASTSSSTTSGGAGISDGESTIKIVNLNVCGLLPAFGRRNGRLAALLEEQDPDIVVFTETHYDPQLPLKLKPQGMAAFQKFLKRYNTNVFGVNPGKPGAAGVSIHSKVAPIKQTKTGLPTWSDPKAMKGRFIAFEYPTFHLIAVYVPHSGDITRIQAVNNRKAWDAALTKYVKDLDKSKPILLVGDMNVAPTDDDAYASSVKRSNQWGCVLPHERQGWQALPNPAAGTNERRLVDSWKHLHPNDPKDIKIYTHTNLKGELNIHSGFRIDHFVISERIVDKLVTCEILHEEKCLTDHIPIVLDIKLSLG